jgi:hypothetical protein
VAIVLVGASLVRDALWRRPRPFDAAVWRAEAANVDGRSARHAMAGEARDRLLRERPTREQAHRLLGPPCFTVEGADWWTLGMSPGIAVSDDCGLQVEYDADGRVADVLLAHETE